MEIDASSSFAMKRSLAELYAPALERSVRKQLDHLDDLCRAFIAASPLVIIGSQGERLPTTRRAETCRASSKLPMITRC